MALLSEYLTKARISRILPYLKGNVLDLGCGTGRIYRDYRAMMASYCGIERSKESIKNLNQQYPDACFLQRDLDQDRFDIGKQFDCILMIAIIEHLFNQLHVMEEVTKVLKPDGVVVITTPTPFGNDVVHRIGTALGLFAQAAVDDHIVIYNRHRFCVLTKEIGLVLKHYETFQFFCNQLAILTWA